MRNKIIFFYLPLLLFTSCATILNKQTTVVKISSDTNSKIIHLQDTLNLNKKQIKIYPKRVNSPLKITIVKDNLKKDFYFESKRSALFWANIFSGYGIIGLFIDLTNNKRLTYPHNLHFVTDSLTNQIVLSNKKIALLPKNKFFLYTSPLQFLDFFNEPMASLGAEYFLLDNVSISGEYGFKNSTIRFQNYNVKFLDDKAAIFRIETKWYNGINLTKNVHLNEYLGFEFRQIKSQYNDNINYYNKEAYNLSYNNISDDFATQKTVSILNLKYGILVPIGKKLYFDFYTGLGLRVKNYKHLNLEYDKTIHQINYDDIFIFYDNDFKNYTKKSFLNVSLGCKFGIRL